MVPQQFVITQNNSYFNVISGFLTGQDAKDIKEVMEITLDYRYKEVENAREDARKKAIIEARGKKNPDAVRAARRMKKNSDDAENNMKKHNFATVLVKYRALDDFRSMLFSRNSSGGYNVVPSTHAERLAWDDAQCFFKNHPELRVERIIVFSELPPCQKYQNNCSEFFSPNGGASKMSESLQFIRDRDIFCCTNANSENWDNLIKDAEEAYNMIQNSKEKKKILHNEQKGAEACVSSKLPNVAISNAFAQFLGFKELLGEEQYALFVTNILKSIKAGKNTEEMMRDAIQKILKLEKNKFVIAYFNIEKNVIGLKNALEENFKEIQDSIKQDQSRAWGPNDPRYFNITGRDFKTDDKGDPASQQSASSSSSSSNSSSSDEDRKRKVDQQKEEPTRQVEVRRESGGNFNRRDRESKEKKESSEEEDQNELGENTKSSSPAERGDRRASAIFQEKADEQLAMALAGEGEDLEDQKAVGESLGMGGRGGPLVSGEERDEKGTDEYRILSVKVGLIIVNELKDKLSKEEEIFVKKISSALSQERNEISEERVLKLIENSVSSLIVRFPEPVRKLLAEKIFLSIKIDRDKREQPKPVVRAPGTLIPAAKLAGGEPPPTVVSIAPLESWKPRRKRKGKRSQTQESQLNPEAPESIPLSQQLRQAPSLSAIPAALVSALRRSMSQTIGSPSSFPSNHQGSPRTPLRSMLASQAQSQSKPVQQQNQQQEQQRLRTAAEVRSSSSSSSSSLSSRSGSSPSSSSSSSSAPTSIPAPERPRDRKARQEARSIMPERGGGGPSAGGRPVLPARALSRKHAPSLQQLARVPAAPPSVSVAPPNNSGAQLKKDGDPFKRGPG